MSAPLLGVIGGLGPLATARFLERVVEMTDAKREQEHVDMLIYQRPSIPDRTGYILGTSRESPLPGLLEAGLALAERGAEGIVIPCVTAQYFRQALVQALPVPVLDPIAGTVELLKAQGIGRVGLLATDGTLQAGVLTRALEEGEIQSVLPGKALQKRVMAAIYGTVKAGFPPDPALLPELVQGLGEMDAVVLGCTELSLLDRRRVPVPCLDMLDVMARQSVEFCRKPLKEPYKDLLKGDNTHADQYSGIFGRNFPDCAG